MRWLVTGCAGFIGSHVLEALLARGDKVVGLDDLSTGYEHNLELVREQVGVEAWRRFSFTKGSILDAEVCRDLCSGIDIVCHQAALGSVPRSIKDPSRTNRVNVEGSLNIFHAAKDSGVRRVIYASSSSVYGDSAELPKREAVIGNPLSPYAVSKRANELYAGAFGHVYGMEFIGLRYFNVFGPRQDPKGDYAAVIPRWIDARRNGRECVIFGDGLTSRDFCYVGNVVQACLKSAEASSEGCGRTYNIAVGGNTTLSRLYDLIEAQVHAGQPPIPPRFQEFRAGDVRHSQADISLARDLIGYEPKVTVEEGIQRTVNWFLQQPVRSHDSC